MQKAQMGKAWRSLSGTVWQREIDVRDFVVANVTAYAGGPDFLAEHNARTQAVWDRFQPYFLASAAVAVQLAPA